MSKKGLLPPEVKETKTYENITITGFNYALVQSKIVFYHRPIALHHCLLIYNFTFLFYHPPAKLCKGNVCLWGGI